MQYYNIAVILRFFAWKIVLLFTTRRGGKGLPGTLEPMTWHVRLCGMCTPPMVCHTNCERFEEAPSPRAVFSQWPRSSTGNMYIDMWHTCYTQWHCDVWPWPWLASRLFRHKKTTLRKLFKNDPRVQLWSHVTFFYETGMVDSRRLKKMRNKNQISVLFCGKLFFLKMKKNEKKWAKKTDNPF